jgi:hypothetical protein
VPAEDKECLASAIVVNRAVPAGTFHRLASEISNGDLSGDL